jgi:hypothetical protein
MDKIFTPVKFGITLNVYNGTFKTFNLTNDEKISPIYYAEQNIRFCYDLIPATLTATTASEYHVAIKDFALPFGKDVANPEEPATALPFDCIVTMYADGNFQVSNNIPGTDAEYFSRCLLAYSAFTIPLEKRRDGITKII